MSKAIDARTRPFPDAGVESDAGGYIADEALVRLLGFHLRMAHLVVYRNFSLAMSELDITQKQFAVLTLVASNPGIAQTAISQRLGADRATILGVVDRLETRGLLRRARAKADRRRQELYLTTVGKRTLAEAQTRVDTHEARFTRQFSRGELGALFEALKRIQTITPID